VRKIIDGKKTADAQDENVAMSEFSPSPDASPADTPADEPE
jgi:hypothetical protein